MNRILRTLLGLSLAAAPLHAQVDEQPAAGPPPVQAVQLEGVRPLHRVGHVLLGGQPDEVAFEALVNDGVGTVIDLRRPSEGRGFDQAEVMDVLGIEYVLLGFGGPDPLSDAIFDRARAAMRSTENGDVLLHCASSNRVGAVWLTRRVLDEGVDWAVALEEAHRVGLSSDPMEAAARTYVLGAGNQELGRVKEQIRGEFPTVPGTSVRELAARMQAAKAPLLLDARSRNEFAVSHIPGSTRAETSEAALQALGDSAKDREVVVYCSVGYRSARLAQELRGAGYSAVVNLEGSIFEWANTGHTVHSDGKPAKTVHPFNAEWGRLLKPELRAKLAH